MWHGWPNDQRARCSTDLSHFLVMPRGQQLDLLSALLICSASRTCAVRHSRRCNSHTQDYLARVERERSLIIKERNLIIKENGPITLTPNSAR